MAKTNLGRVGMVLKGTYDGNTPYKKLDVVSHLGSSYVAKKDVFGIDPPNEEYWQEIAGIGTMVQDTRNAAEAAISAANSSKAAEASALTAVKNANDAVANANRAANRVEQMQIDASGLAGDSNKLGGKPASHYLPAVQLLDNPDFVIAQAGYGAPHGSVYYAADRWITYVSTQITKTGNGMQITNKPDTTRSYEAIYQNFNAPVHNMSDGATMGVCIDGVVYVLQCGVGETKAANAKSGVAITCSITVNGERSYAQINVTKGYAVTVNWIVMYPGTYTADTLPPFVPRPYAVELAECQKVLMPIPTDAILTGFSGTNGVVNLFVPCPYMSPTAVPSVINGDSVDIAVVGNNVVQTCTGWTVNKYANGGVIITTPTILSAVRAVISGSVVTADKRMFISCEP